ncbi:hypothetical protein ACA910_004167 [Epithemia clementina (nom. ined.)]
MFTQTKWEKAKTGIAHLRSEVDQAFSPTGDGLASHKILKQVAGFFNHVAPAFLTIRKYRNGIYATMSTWCRNEDKEGWCTGNEKYECDSANAPTKVHIVNQMRLDVEVHWKGYCNQASMHQHLDIALGMRQEQGLVFLLEKVKLQYNMVHGNWTS